MTQTDPAPENDAPFLPMAGVKVVELSTMITASFAAMFLAEQGADVIKIEPLTGDPMRGIGSQKPGMSALFANCNKGKRSAALNLKDPDDLALARRLCLGADVVISNYRPSVMARIGLSYPALSKDNPGLIFARITGFGLCGDQSGAPAYDHVVQAQLGYTVAQGDAAPGGQPVHIQHALCDKVTGVMTAQAIASALFARERPGPKHGQGARIDLSMLDAGMHFFFPDGLMHHTILDDEAVHAAPLSSTYFTFQAKDGWFTLAALSEPQWLAVFRLADRPDMIELAQFKNGRLVNFAEVMGALATLSFDHTLEDLRVAFEAADVPFAPCNSPEEAMQDAQLAACDTVQVVQDPYLGPIRAVRPAALFNGQIRKADAPAPQLGQHTDAIRREG